MSRAVVILVAVLLAGAALFTAAFWFASKVSCQQLSRPTDDLAWLEAEFRLSGVEMERVRELHAGYLPVCQSFCEQITAEKAAVGDLVRAGQSGSDEARARLTEIGRLRARCQAAMLEHFERVSRAMPPEQGQRYLEEMRRITLGSHEQIEQSMSGGSGNGHVHQH